MSQRSSGVGRVLRVIGKAVLVLVLSGLLLWIGLSLHFQIAAPLVYLFYLLLALVALLAAVMIWRGRWALAWGLAAAMLAVWTLWWAGFDPQQDRDWMPEVSRGVTSEPVGEGLLRVRDIRDFRWSSPTEAEESWYDLVVDPQAIVSVGMIMSVWDNPDIAHTLVSFGFSDGRHIVFSAEIRKEKGEAFSSIGGVFKRYELVLIAADERDIVHLRTDARGETVSIYPVIMGPEQRTAFFLSFLELGNALAREPRWYQTLWANCTTVPFRLVRRLADGIVFDLRIVLSGRLPGYLYDLGALPGAGTAPLATLMERAALPRRDVAGLSSEEYSRLLRVGWQQ